MHPNQSTVSHKNSESFPRYKFFKSPSSLQIYNPVQYSPYTSTNNCGRLLSYYFTPFTLGSTFQLYETSLLLQHRRVSQFPEFSNGTRKKRDKTGTL